MADECGAACLVSNACLSLPFAAQRRLRRDVVRRVTVVGDLHGQFYDLLQLLSPEVGGEPPDSAYVFLGDFVDRGHHSVETLSLLLCLKLKFPGHVTLLRGNHEVTSRPCSVALLQ